MSERGTVCDECGFSSSILGSAANAHGPTCSRNPARVHSLVRRGRIGGGVMIVCSACGKRDASADEKCEGSR